MPLAEVPTEPEGRAPADPVEADKVVLAREFATQLGRSLKQIGMYRHNAAKYGEYLQAPYDALGRYTTQHGALSLKVEPNALTLFRQPILEAQGHDNLPFRLYRDGIRQLILRPELTPQELSQFVLIALSDPRRDGEDLLSQLWRAGFAHLEYVVVEGFAMGDATEAQVSVEVDQVVGYLYSRLQSASEDSVSATRLRVDDLDLAFEGVEQIRGAVLSGQPIPDELKTELQDQLREDETRLFDVVTEAILAALAAGAVDGAGQTAALFARVLDALLVQEDFAAIVQLKDKLAAATADPDHAAIARELLRDFTLHMGDEQRLRQLGGMLSHALLTQSAGVRAYLDALDTRALLPLLDILDTLEDPDERGLLVEALIRLGKTMPEPFLNRLKSEKSQMVRDMLRIVDRCDFPQKVAAFGQALAHRNPAVRREVFALLGKTPSELSRKVLVEQLADPGSPARPQIARALAEVWPERALVELTRIVRAPDFDKAPLEDRKTYFEALGVTGDPGAFALFMEHLQRHSVLARRRVSDGKLCAIAGLTQMGGVTAYRALQEEHGNAANPDEVKEAALKGMLALRRQILGDGPGKA